MDFEKLSALDGISAEMKVIIDEGKATYDAAIQAVTDTKVKLGEYAETRDSFKQRNTLVKDILGIDKINEESVRKAISGDADKLSELAKTIQGLQSENSVYKNKTTVQDLAIKNNIKEVDMFELLYNDSSKKDDFKSEDFIKTLSETKPYLFTEVKEVEDPKPNLNNANSQNKKVNEIGRSAFEQLNPKAKMDLVLKGTQVKD